jgi:hypothetical protein
MRRFAPFLHALFGFDRPETRGYVAFFAFFELFVVAFTARYAWAWSLVVQSYGDVVLPLGMANYVDVSVFFGSPLAFAAAGVLTLGLLLGWTRRWRYGYLVAMVVFHVLFAARYSQGEIPHSSNVIGMTLLGLGLAVAAFDDEHLRRRFTMGFAYFSVGLGYTLAAFCKLVARGLTWPDGRHLWMWVYEKSVDTMAQTGTFEFNVVQQLVLDYYPLATLFLTVGLVSELLAWTMWWPRFRTLALLAVLGLHAGIYLTMEIVFLVTTGELVLLAVPWACLLDRLVLHVKPSEGPVAQRERCLGLNPFSRPPQRASG